VVPVGNKISTELKTLMIDVNIVLAGTRGLRRHEVFQQQKTTDINLRASSSY